MTSVSYMHEEMERDREKKGKHSVGCGHNIMTGVGLKRGDGQRLSRVQELAGAEQKIEKWIQVARFGALLKRRERERERKRDWTARERPAHPDNSPENPR